MGLFNADLYRNLAIGFALGTAIVGIQIGSTNWHAIAPAVATILPF